LKPRSKRWGKEEREQGAWKFEENKNKKNAEGSPSLTLQIHERNDGGVGEKRKVGGRQVRRLSPEESNGLTLTK